MQITPQIHIIARVPMDIKDLDVNIFNCYFILEMQTTDLLGYCKKGTGIAYFKGSSGFH